MILLSIEHLVRTLSLLHLSPDLRILVHINLWSGQLRRQLILANDYRRLSLEETIDVFESAIGCLWVEEVGDWNESEADAGLLVVFLSASRRQGCREWVGWTVPR